MTAPSPPSTASLGLWCVQSVAWVKERVAGPDAVATLAGKGHDTVVLAMGAGLRWAL